ncbi:MAG: hypothetical protein M1837_006658 [Sclerophora amabilis]|nr:MAG: hypothetical protein M1837_006658 [Sclerophora amabilis]
MLDETGIPPFERNLPHFVETSPMHRPITPRLSNFGPLGPNRPGSSLPWLQRTCREKRSFPGIERKLVQDSNHLPNTPLRQTGWSTLQPGVCSMENQWPFLQIHSEPLSIDIPPLPWTPADTALLGPPLPLDPQVSELYLPRLPEMDPILKPAEAPLSVGDDESPHKRKADSIVEATLDSARKAGEETAKSFSGSRYSSAGSGSPAAPRPQASVEDAAVKTSPDQDELQARAEKTDEEISAYLEECLPYPPPATYRLVNGPDGRILRYITPIRIHDQELDAPEGDEPSEEDEENQGSNFKREHRSKSPSEAPEVNETTEEAEANLDSAIEPVKSRESPVSEQDVAPEPARKKQRRLSSPEAPVRVILRPRRSRIRPVWAAITHEAAGPSKRSLAARRRWKKDRDIAELLGKPLRQWGR